MSSRPRGIFGHKSLTKSNVILYRVAYKDEVAFSTLIESKSLNDNFTFVFLIISFHKFLKVICVCVCKYNR